jgi:nucleotide-binding universal stress UspA family protein
METVVIGSSKPEKTLVEQARLRKADVIVMGRRGQAGHLSRLVGKMTTRVIAQGFSRILVAPKDCRIAGSHILAAVDDSANGHRVAQEALSLGLSCSTLQKMTVVSVAAKEGARTLAERLVDDVCRQLEQGGVPVPCEPLVAVGDPASVLAAVARDREVDMILIGGWGRSGVAKLLKGHVTENVICRAHCAVLVVTA